MAIGDHIRDLRWDAHLKQVELARRAGIAQNTLSQIEIGNTVPSVPTLEKLARALGVPADELLKEPVPLADAPYPGRSAHVSDLVEEVLIPPTRLTPELFQSVLLILLQHEHQMEHLYIVIAGGHVEAGLGPIQEDIHEGFGVETAQENTWAEILGEVLGRVEEAQRTRTRGE